MTVLKSILVICLTMRVIASEDWIWAF